MGQIHSLDNLSSEWKWGPSARWTIAIGSTGSLTSVSGVMPANQKMRLFSKWKFASQFLTFNLLLFIFQFPQHKNKFWRREFFYSVKYSYIHHWQRSGPYHLRTYLNRALFQTPCRFFGDHTFRFGASIWTANWKFETMLHISAESIGLWVFHVMLGILYYQILWYITNCIAWLSYNFNFRYYFAWFNSTNDPHRNSSLPTLSPFNYTPGPLNR